jgi:hypothetical protein
MLGTHKINDKTAAVNAEELDWMFDEDDLAVLRERMEWTPRRSEEQEDWLDASALRRRRTHRVRDARRGRR